MSKEKIFCVSRQNSVLSFTPPNLSFECSTEFGGTLLHFEPSADYGDDELSEGEVVYNCKLGLFGIVVGVGEMIDVQVVGIGKNCAWERADLTKMHGLVM